LDAVPSPSAAVASSDAAPSPSAVAASSDAAPSPSAAVASPDAAPSHSAAVASSDVGSAGRFKTRPIKTRPSAFSGEDRHAAGVTVIGLAAATIAIGL
jgi:hypothetical protein